MATGADFVDDACYQSAEDVAVSIGQEVRPSVFPVLEGAAVPASSSSMIDVRTPLFSGGDLLSSLPTTTSAAVIPTSAASPTSFSSAGNAAVLSTSVPSVTSITSTTAAFGNNTVPSGGPSPPPPPSYAAAASVPSGATGQPTGAKPKIRHFTSSSTYMTSWLSRAISFKASRQNTTMNDYLRAISQTVPRGQITDCARVSGTIQIYFKNASWAQQLIATGLDFQGEHIDILPILVAPKRITISNVPPFFPDTDLRTLMSDFGQVQGRVERLPASIDTSEHGTIFSNRRAVSILFATEKADEDLPPSVECFHNQRKLTFYLNNPFKCHGCKEIGQQNIPPSPPLSSSPSPVSGADATLPALSSSLAGSSVPMDSPVAGAFGFKFPRKRSGKKRHSASLVPGPPTKMSAERYSFDPASNSWKDAKGTFTPLVDLQTLTDFITAALDANSADKRRLISALVNDSESASTLARQVTVLTYTDPEIAAIESARMRFTYLAKLILQVFSFSANSTDNQSDVPIDS